MNHIDVEGHQRLAERVRQEQDDVLGALQLVRGDALLEARLFEQLVDLLVEGLFVELRQQHLAGDLARDVYVEELSELAERCRDAGLLPLPTWEV